MMVEEPAKTLRDMVKHVGRYPEDAFLFVREGLAFAADSIHGTESKAHRALQEFLAEQNLDWDDLVAQYHTDALPEAVVEAIDEIGGCDNLNRHVGGREFCWALRDYAINRWGILAQTVLESWRITKTKDFGRIVFGFIDYDLMRKQADDRLEDFEDVFSFDEAFNTPFGEKPKPIDPSPPHS
jgi:uncharacterized repeat protein (TIGR04138 family)